MKGVTDRGTWGGARSRDWVGSEGLKSTPTPCSRDRSWTSGDIMDVNARPLYGKNFLTTTQNRADGSGRSNIQEPERLAGVGGPVDLLVSASTFSGRAQGRREGGSRALGAPWEEGLAKRRS